MPDRADMIWIEDAAKEYEVSRRYLEQLVNAGTLSQVRWPGSRQTFLLRSELARHFQPKVVKPATDAGSDAGSQAG